MVLVTAFLSINMYYLILVFDRIHTHSNKIKIFNHSLNITKTIADFKIFYYFLLKKKNLKIYQPD